MREWILNGLVLEYPLSFVYHDYATNIDFA